MGHVTGWLEQQQRPGSTKERKKEICVFTFLSDVVHFYIVSSEAQDAGAQQGAATNSSSRDVTRLAGSRPKAGGWRDSVPCYSTNHEP